MSTVGVLLVDRALNVVASVAPERGHNTDPFRERRRALSLLIAEPATLFEVASQSLDRGRLVTVADDDHFPRLEVDLPTLDPVVDIALEDDFGPVLEVGVHLPVTVRPDHTGEIGVAVSEGEIECSTVLMEIRDLASTADTVEGRRIFDDRRNPVVQL